MQRLPGYRGCHLSPLPNQTQIALVRMRGAASGDIIAIPAQGGFGSTHCGRFAWRSPGSIGWHGTRNGVQIAFASQSLESGRSTVFLMRLADGSAEPDESTGRCDWRAPPPRSLPTDGLSHRCAGLPTTSTRPVQKLGDGMVDTGRAGSRSRGWESPGITSVGRQQAAVVLGGSSSFERGSGCGRRTALLVGRALGGSCDRWTKDCRISTDRRGATERSRGTHLDDCSSSRGPARMDRPSFCPASGNSDNPDYSPDSKHIVFVSPRSDTPELWMTDADGNNLKQLTRLGVQSLGCPDLHLLTIGMSPSLPGSAPSPRST